MFLYIKKQRRSKKGFFSIMVVGSGKGLPSLRCLVGLREWSTTTGLKQGLNFIGSSKESWTMHTSAIQQASVWDEGVLTL